MATLSNLHEKREYIQNENNTAQTQLIGILGELPKTIPGLYVNTIFHGDIDFSILQEDFPFIKKIELIKGEITNIQGIYEGITSVNCPGNLLTELPDLPVSLVELNLSANYIEYANFENTPNIKKINMAYNSLTTIENLPPSLEELDIRINKISFLDLSTLVHLRVLNVKGNKSIVLKNIPPSLVDLQMDEDPFQPVDYEEEEEKKEEEEDHTKDSEDSEERTKITINYHDALNEYFDMKQKYESHILNDKRDLYEKGKTRKEKKELIQSYHPKCVKCKRPVGTIFKIKNNHYVAICGDKKEPCNLNIKIYKGVFYSFETMLYQFKEEVEKIKETIIKQKLDTLFNYINEGESVIIFKHNLEQYHLSNNIYQELIKRYNTYYNNEIHDEKIKEKMEEINDIVRHIQEMIEEYNKRTDEKWIEDIVEIERTNLFPEIQNLRMLHYKIMEMNHSTHLFQKQLALTDYEYSFEEQPRVVRFTR
jgi:hypothetical protein